MMTPMLASTTRVARSPSCGVPFSSRLRGIQCEFLHGLHESFVEFAQGVVHGPKP